MHRLPARSESHATRRFALYAGIATAMTLTLVVWRGSGVSSAELHTLTEVAATPVAVFVGLMALARYFAQREAGLLILGAGFMGTGLLDGYHALLTSPHFNGDLPTGLAALAPWSWTASRLLLAAMMLLAIIVARQGTEAKRAWTSRRVLGTVGAATAATFLLFALVRLPAAYYDDLPIHRPGELVPGALFLAAAAIHYRWGTWRNHVLAHWVMMALVVSVVTQLVIMPQSLVLFDFPFRMAHVMKITSYLMVLTGLIMGMYQVFGAAERRRIELESTNTRLSHLVSRKDDFLASVTHELRTPLTAVVGFIEVLRDPESQLSGDERSDLMLSVAQQGFDLVNIVEDLLVGARADLGELTLASVGVDLTAQAAQVTESLPDARERVAIHRGEPVPVQADPVRVRQILRNLISKAIKYGGPNITVHASAGTDRGVVTVVDDGAGIAPADRERIFEPYQRAHHDAGLTASVGIGLYVSRRLAGMMGGDLSYDYRRAQSVFTLALPLAERTKSAAAPGSELAASGA